MWKKLFMMVGLLILTVSVGCAYYNFNLFAANPYQAGGAVTGRVNIAPSGLTGAGSNIGMQKGDKVYVGGTNPYTNNPLGWQLLKDAQNYPTYNVTITAGSLAMIRDLNITMTQSGTTSAWYTMSTESIEKKNVFNVAEPTYFSIPAGNAKALRGMRDASQHNPYLTINNMDAQMQTANSFNLVRAPYLATYSDLITKSTGSSDDVLKVHLRQLRAAVVMLHDKSILLPDQRPMLKFGQTGNLSTTVGFGLAGKDLAFSERYFTLSSALSQDFSGSKNPISGKLWSNAIMADGKNAKENSSVADVRVDAKTQIAFRAASMLNLDDVVFAVSPGSNNSTASVTETLLPSGYTNIYTATFGDHEMKLRLYNNANPISVSLTDILHKRNSTSVSSVAKGTTVNIKARAENRGTVVSVLLFKDGKFAYYEPLEPAKGDSQDYLYDFDTSNVAAGDYQVAIVNEIYDDSTTDPTYSSYLSDVLPLTITEPLSNLNFTPRTDLQANNNVNVRDTVGIISSQNGVQPITYTIIEDPAYPGEYQNVTLASDGKTVVVNGAALDAKTYHFKIQAKDTNNDPDPALEINASITVIKKPTSIAFDNPSQTKKSVAQAIAGWSETATANPNNSDVKVAYSIVSTQGNISTGDIAIDPDTGALTYTGNGAYGKITLQASVDDIPGKDNYDPSTATKEVVIYRDLNGSFNPHQNSSSGSTPIFSASDINAKTGGIIGTLQGSMGTPDNAVSGTTTYTYDIKQVDEYASFEINANTGDLKSKVNLGVGDHNITLLVKDKWSTKEIPLIVKIEQANAEDLQFYENAVSNTVINTKTVSFTATNVSVYAMVKGSSNSNPVIYAIKNGDTSIIDVNSSSGAITINGAGTAVITATKQGVSGQSDAYAELTVTVTAAEQNFIYTDNTLINELPKTGTSYKTYEEVYAPNKTFNVYTAGNPPGTTVTYQLKAVTGSSNDVISVDPDGKVHILNASRSADIGKVTIEATSHDPNGNYNDKTIELPITINRGTRTVEFADAPNPIYAINGTGMVTPSISIDGNPDMAGSAVIEVDPNKSSIAWTNNGKDIEYSYNGDNGIDIDLSVGLSGDRNYENATNTGALHILGADEAMLTVSSPGRITYGDNFTVRSTQNDSASTNVQYTFDVDNTTYISEGTVNVQEAQFDALKSSGDTEIIITVIRTADGEKPLTKKVKVKVLPKPIQITVEDKAKLKGEANPQLTFEDFTAQLVSWNKVTDVIQSSDVKLTTTANQNSPVGSYPIKGDANYLNNTYPNYIVTFVDGTLAISEENIEDSWYHMETDDGQPYQGDWTNQDVNIISDHSDYVNISKDQSTWNAFVSVVQEGSYEQSFWMKKDSGAITSEKKETIKIDKTPPKVKYIKAKDSNNKLQDIINKLSGGIFFRPGTSFEITTDDKNGQLDVSGTESIAYKIYKQDKDENYGDAMLEDTLTVSNEKANITISETTGTYKVCVIPTDEAGNTGTESCHEVTLKRINEDVDDDDEDDFIDTDDDGCPDVSIKWKDDDGKWVVINGDRNDDKIPDFNIDSDGDGVPDLNLDTDDDGIPDINIVILKKSDWKPKICVKADEDKGIKEEYCTGTSVKPQINVDLDGDGIPDINIDNKGDFKPHLNISKDGKTPSINIVKLHTWTPNKNYQSNKFTYDSIGDSKSDPQPEINLDTDNDGRPDINLDLDGDGTADINIDSDGDRIPDLNIDSTGDGKPDINVDVSGNGYPEENIMEIKEWKPEHNVDDPFPYDTMKLESKKELENNGVKVEKNDGTFPMNVTLKVTDITKDKQSEVSEKAKDLIGEQSVIQVFDVKLLKNGKEIQPDGTLKVKIPVKANIKNPSLLILNETGEYEKVEATYENGYLIYETDHLGQFTIIGDVDNKMNEEPVTDVKGTYYPGDNMGGAVTGDTTNMMMYMGLGCMSIGMMLLILYKVKQED